MYLENDIAGFDKSNIIVEKLEHTIMMHVRENYTNGSVKREARIKMDRHLVTMLIDYLIINKPDTKTHSELWADRSNDNE